MRKKIFLFTTILGSIIGIAKAEEIVKNERVQKVILFRSAAQIESRVSQTLEKGDHLIIIDELPNAINDNSVQISGEGGFTILSVETKTGLWDQKKRGKQYSSLVDSIEYYTNAIEQDNIRKYAIDQEESLLITNKDISSKQNMAVVDIEDMADLYRKRLPDLKRESLRLQKTIDHNKEKLEGFNLQLSERQSGKNNKQVWVRVSLTQAQNVKINLKYIVYDAGWVPFYDIRSIDIGEEITFVLKAKIRQNTGVNWDNVDLTLSTGNPINSSIKPELNDWRLSLAEIAARQMYKSGGQLNAEEIVKLPTRNINSLITTSAGVYASDVTTQEQVNNVQYSINKAFSIASDGEYKIVEIQKNSAKATYRYVTVPKLDTKAYLMASVKEWDSFLLLPGEANIFLKGDYVTKTVIDPMSIDDSLEISLGNDEGIKVERKMVKELTSKKSFGSTKRYMQGYDITVRNSKSRAIKIDVIDQVPLSSDKDIEVKHTANGASFEESTGKLTWSYTILPSETKKMNLQIEVKYPKNKYLQGW